MAILVFDNGLAVKNSPSSGDYEVDFVTMYGRQKGFYRVRASKDYKYIAKKIKKADAINPKKYTPKKYISWLSGAWLDVK